MLSCECSYEDAPWWYYTPDGFSLLKKKRRERCCSCKKLIDIGSECVEFDRNRNANSDIEDRIYGCDDVPLANWYMCEHCGEIFLNLEELGYCIDLGTPMDEFLAEYWELTGFKPLKH